MLTGIAHERTTKVLPFYFNAYFSQFAPHEFEHFRSKMKTFILYLNEAANIVSTILSTIYFNQK